MKHVLFSIVLIVCVAAAEVNLNALIPELKLTDGRILKQVTLVAFSPTAVMAKWEGGRGTLAYEKFPAEYHAALAKRRDPNAEYVSRPDNAPPASAKPEQGPPVEIPLNAVTLGKIDLRAIEHSSSGAFVYYSWTAQVINSTDSSRSLRTHLRLYDAKEFLLDEAYGDDVTVPAGKIVTASGKSMMKSNLWEQVKSYKVGLLR